MAISPPVVVGDFRAEHRERCVRGDRSAACCDRFSTRNCSDFAAFVVLVAIVLACLRPCAAGCKLDVTGLRRLRRLNLLRLRRTS